MTVEHTNISHFLVEVEPLHLNLLQFVNKAEWEAVVRYLLTDNYLEVIYVETVKLTDIARCHVQILHLEMISADEVDSWSITLNQNNGPFRLCLHLL